MYSIGEIISTYRKKKGLLQQDLADELAKEGITISYKAISNWERNLAEPSVTIFYKVCRILGITNMYEAYFGVNPADPFSSLTDKGREKAMDYRVVRDGKMSSIVCCDGGVFRFYPPTSANPEWTIETLLETPASDATLIDFDGDGKDELLVLSPFHGDTVLIYREKDGKYELDYEYPEKIEFLHAIWSGEIQGKPVVMIGHRKGNRDLLKFCWENGQCHLSLIHI